ncbi:MAG TPA: thioredoxin family protein [Flavobacteriaceae bacterium]|jgi:thioredoxin-related protein|nr:thioredoxin family protein [Flavobacteriaceae bacterium]HBS11539.1 thioredoxin family protein [Flavobacteriaceae bacterium]
MKIKILFISLAFLFIQQAQSQESTKAILDQAYNQAKIENKNVFVLFTASWCGWCKKLDANMNEAATKNLFDDNFVVVHLDVLERGAKKSLETPGGVEFLKKHNAEKSGLPFFLIFDAYGKKLADSNNAKGQNIGCPATAEEVAVFTGILKKTSTLLGDELAVIAEVFQEKKSN